MWDVKVDKLRFMLVIVVLHYALYYMYCIFSLCHMTCSTKNRDIIQIWTCDEANMEFYGSEATILSEAKPRSILLPKIYRTHIARHHWSIFALLYVGSIATKILLLFSYIHTLQLHMKILVIICNM